MHHGIIWLMTVVPFWVQPIVTWIFFQVGIRGLRWWQEGVPYDHSLASVWGDLALLCILATASHILQHTADMYVLADLLPIQILAAGVSYMLGYTIFSKNAVSWGDIFHAHVVAPIVIYQLFLSGSIVAVYGGWRLIALCLVFATIWAVFLALDIAQERLDQQAYRAKLGKS